MKKTTVAGSLCLVLLMHCAWAETDPIAADQAGDMVMQCLQTVPGICQDSTAPAENSPTEINDQVLSS